MLNYKKLTTPHLTKEQERDLFKQYHIAKDPKVKNEILENFSSLVFFYAKKICHKKFQFEDLVQEGFLGLNVAIDKFKLDADCRFMFYAGYWVKAQMYAFVYNNHMLVNVPASAKFLRGFWKIRQFKNLTNEELAEKLELSIENIETLQIILGNPEMSLDAPARYEYGADKYDSVSFKAAIKNASVTSFEEHFIEHQEQHFKLNIINNRLKNLKDNEQEVFLEYYMNDKTFAEIGKERDVTRQRIEQIHRSAVGKIKQSLNVKD